MIDLDKLETLAREIENHAPVVLLPPSHYEDSWHVRDEGDTAVVRCYGFGNDGKGDVARQLAAYIEAANPAVMLALIAELRAKNALLEEIFDDCGGKNKGACPVCSTYTHKHWCWYPHLAKMLGKPLDENDECFLMEEKK